MYLSSFMKYHEIIECDLDNIFMHGYKNITLVSAIIGVPIPFISSHFRFTESVKSNSIVSICNIYIDSTCEFELVSIEY